VERPDKTAIGKKCLPTLAASRLWGIVKDNVTWEMPVMENHWRIKLGISSNGLLNLGREKLR
jgi:hypothetical protein